MALGEFALAVLEGGSLEAKLLEVPVEEEGPRVMRFPALPARARGLGFVHGIDRLPRLTDLHDVHARASCLHRFANHELQAIELFAWAILAFQDAPIAFRMGLCATLKDEQRHLRAYLRRMDALGMHLGDEPLSGNFLEQAAHISSPLAFVCAMGLTFENANLDFSLLYRDAFRRHGAEEDAAVMDQVHRDELGHVAFALSWLRRLKHHHESDADAYLRATPFPLGLHRAKGRNFVASARKRIGMDDEFIRRIREARAPREASPLRLQRP